MLLYTLEQRWEILQHCFENHGNVAECTRKLSTDFGRREAPSAPYVRYLVKQVKETGILIDKPKREKPKTVRASKNTAAVSESVCEAPSTSIHRRSQQLNFSETSLKRILYKVQLIQESKSIDHPMRFHFAKWACDRLTKDANFRKKIIFSDETYFGTGGYVNKQNCRNWGTENQHTHIKKPTHPKRVTYGADFGPEA